MANRPSGREPRREQKRPPLRRRNGINEYADDDEDIWRCFGARELVVKVYSMRR
jgi:hypothetical protein